MSNIEDRIRGLQLRAVIPPTDEAIPTDYLGIADDGSIAWLSLSEGLEIGDLPDAAALDGSEFVAIEQGGVTVKTTTQDIADLGGSGGFPIGPQTEAVAMPAGNPATFEIAVDTEPNWAGAPAMWGRAKSGSDDAFSLFVVYPPDNDGDFPGAVILVSDDLTRRAFLNMGSQGAAWQHEVNDPAVLSFLEADIQSLAIIDGAGKQYAYSAIAAATGSIFDPAADVGWQNQIVAWAYGNGADGEPAPARAGSSFFAPIYLSKASSFAGNDHIKTPEFPSGSEHPGGDLALYAFDTGSGIELRVKFLNGTVVTLASD